MKQTAVEWYEKEINSLLEKYESKEISTLDFIIIKHNLFDTAKEMEKEQIIEAGNSCAFKQHLHSERINKMSMDELEQYDLEPSYTFGEEYYNETFNK
jgi:hypothetical protein